MATQNSWNNTINSATTVTLNGATVNVGSDASASTINLATGADVKTVTLGSTNTTSKLDLKYGTADFTLASDTGTVIKAEDTGEMTMPLQPAFLSKASGNAANVTGDGTAYTVVIFNTDIYDQNADYVNGVFTAPVTGRYFFEAKIHISASLATANTSGSLSFVASNRTLITFIGSPGAVRSAGNSLTLLGNVEVDMDAADTLSTSVIVSGGGKTVGIYGSNDTYTSMSGYLIC